MEIPSFYTSSETLNWKQWLHNCSTEVFRIPFIHQNYDLIHVGSLGRSRITIRFDRAELFKLILKVALVIALVAPLFGHYYVLPITVFLLPLYSYYLTCPSASQTSWALIDQLFNVLTKQEKEDFFYIYLTKNKIIENSPYRQLHQIAESYRASGMVADLIIRLLSLDPEVEKNVKAWESDAVDHTFCAIVTHCLENRKPHLHRLFPFLSGKSQIEILKKCDKKEALKLCSLSTKAAIAYPAQFLSCLIPRELKKGDYGITLSGSPNLAHRSRDLLEKIPNTYQAFEQLLPSLPKASIIRIFWDIAKSERKELWIEKKLCEYAFNIEKLSEEEKELIRRLPFDQVKMLTKFSQPWLEIWYKTGQTPERLAEVCFSLPSDHDLDNRKNETFLNLLSHEDLENLIKEDPQFEKLQGIFGYERETAYSKCLSLEIHRSSSRHTFVTIPTVLKRWWDLYESVDFEGRFEKLCTLGVSQAYLTYFCEKHKNAIENKPFLDQFMKMWEELLNQARIPNPIDTAKKRAREKEIKRLQKSLRHFKADLEGLGLNPQISYTKDEISRTFRHLSFKLHPDRGGSEVDFKEISNHRDQLIKRLDKLGLEKTPIP
jgi:hypothetical protein